MARIQILELPRRSVDDEIPFVLIIDHLEQTVIRAWGDGAMPITTVDHLADRIDKAALQEATGALGIIVSLIDLDIETS